MAFDLFKWRILDTQNAGVWHSRPVARKDFAPLPGREADPVTFHLVPSRGNQIIELELFAPAQVAAALPQDGTDLGAGTNFLIGENWLGPIREPSFTSDRVIIPEGRYLLTTHQEAERWEGEFFWAIAPLKSEFESRIAVVCVSSYPKPMAT